jgi:aspartokinase
MQNFCLEKGVKARIGGIKVSFDLALLNLFRPSAVGEAPIFLLQALADNKINISFLTRMENDSGSTCNCCVSVHDLDRVACLFDEAAFYGEQVEVIHKVAVVSVFPHRYQLSVLGTVVGALGQAEISVHAMGTSLSSITVVVDCRSLPRVITLFEEVFDLPGLSRSILPDLRPNQEE